MKPTKKQKEVIKNISNTILSWADTNDIDSPTHYSDISEDLRLLLLDGKIDNKDYAMINHGMSELFGIIQDIKYND